MLTRRLSPDVTRALANLVWLGLERFTQMGVAIFISGLLARYFGPDRFGKWQYANTLLLVLAPVTWVCGAEVLVPTLVHVSRARVPVVLGSAFALRFAVSLAALLLTWAVVAWGPVDHLVAAMLAGLALTLLFREPFVGVINAWLQSITYSKPQLLASMACALVKAALVWLLIRAAWSPASFSWLWAAEAAALSAVLLGYYAWRHGWLDWRVETALFKHFAGAGAVFWLGLICMYGFLKLDRLMLQHYVGFADLGRYAAAQQLNENWITLALMLAQTIAPAFIYRVEDVRQLGRNLARLTAMTAAVMIAGALVLDVLAGPIVARVFGARYLDTAGILRWAVWLSVPAGVEAVGNLMLLKYQAKSVLLAKWALALAVAALVDWRLVPRFGGHGALIGLATGYLCAAAVTFCYIRAKLRLGSPLMTASLTAAPSIVAPRPAPEQVDPNVANAAGNGPSAAVLDDVAVLLPAYNCHADLARTLASIRESAPVRVLVVDDGSEPPLRVPTVQGMLVELLRLPHNRGIETALATGVAHLAARGVTYIARIDAGDLALPGRLARQRNYLARHPGVGAVGTWVEVVARDGTPRFMLCPPAMPERIRRQRFFRTCFVHPAMMLRTAAVLAAGNYRARFPAAEDLDLFLRMMEHCEFANLPQPGLRYALNDTGISAARRRAQIVSTLRLQLHYFAPGNLYDWLGLIKHLLHLITPYAVLTAIKRALLRSGAH